ncbi:MAG: nitrilase-related carbon-nitrogen hydrolase, partial [Chloroflexota bacterium]
MTILVIKKLKSLWIGLVFSGISGILLTASMPGFDVPLIGWIALVPLLITLINANPADVFPLALPFGILFSIGVHNWYPNVFPPLLGYFLVIAVGAYYAGVLNIGTWLFSRLPDSLKLQALPVTWSAFEFIKYITPVLQDWWFVILADSQWRFPPALQILGITGFPGLSFIVMLVNFAFAIIISNGLKKEYPIPFRTSLAGLLITGVVIAFGANAIQQPHDTFKVAVVTDMVYQLPEMQGLGNFAGLLKKTHELSRAIFDNDSRLSRMAAPGKPAFIVWPENGFASVDDEDMMARSGSLAAGLNSYLAVDMSWNSTFGLLNSAVLIGPGGKEIGRRAKINIVAEEADAGIIPGPESFPVFETDFGKAGIAVCWDVHRLWIIRELARSGAQIILLPMDNDFRGISTFPPFHSADAVFRAAENHLAFGLGTVNGLSMVIDPYGRITAEGKINQRGITVGETFVINSTTIYTRYGDWFGWFITIILAAFIIFSIKKNNW